MFNLLWLLLIPVGLFTTFAIARITVPWLVNEVNYEWWAFPAYMVLMLCVILPAAIASIAGPVFLAFG